MLFVVQCFRLSPSIFLSFTDKNVFNCRMGSVGDPMLKFCVHVCISFLIVYVNFGG